MPHGRELAGVNGDLLTVALTGLEFGYPDCADRRVREHHAGDVVVVDPGLGLDAEQPVSQAPSSGDRHGGERRAAGNVADGVDPLRGGPEVPVHGDEAPLVGPDVHRLEPQPLGVGSAAHRHEDPVFGMHPAYSTMTMSLLLPVMIGNVFESGSQVMQRIAAPMVGGMVSAPLLSMFVVPAIYLLVQRRRLKRGAT